MAGAAERLAAAGIDNAAQESRWLVEAVAGDAAAGLVTALDRPAPVGAAARLAAMVDRRAAGEPLQYVLGRWAFRRLEVAVDPRVLIPRPETEVLAGLALDECGRLGARVAVDLGTGSGVLALALAVERPGLEVWATDVSGDALAVAAANRAAAGPAAAAVRLVEGSWWDALPPDLAGRVDVIVANPPYVSDAEMPELPADVRDWEPDRALRAGPTGLEDIEVIVVGARHWLARPGALLIEMAPHQTRPTAHLVEAAGFASVSIWPDLAGRDRVVLARA